MKNLFEKNKNLPFLLVIFAVLILGAFTITLSQQSSEAPTPEIEVAVPVEEPLDAAVTQEQTLLYGMWEGNESIIHAVNLDGTNDTVIAKLPLQIKNIHSVSPTQLVYIANTNNNDHGTRIASYDITTQVETTLSSAEAGWGIDSLIVSPDKSSIAWWEVKLGSGGQLTGGQSNVYSLSLAAANQSKNTVFEESATAGSTVHYPLFFDHSGYLYSDGFVPNTDGWNRGLTRTTADGKNPQVVLPLDSYNTDPVINPVKNEIAFTAFNPVNGANITGNGTGITREAAQNPNSVVVMDLTTNVKRQVISEPGRVYYDPTWKASGDAVFVRSFAVANNELTDQKALTVNTSTLMAEELNAEKLVDGIVLAFNDSGLITGAALPGATTPGNLGQTYAPVLEAITQSDGSQITTIVGNNHAQFIGIASPAVPLGLVNVAYTPGSESLQLASFQLKEQLAQRPAQQNDVKLDLGGERMKCKDVYNALKAQTQPVSETVMPTIDPSGANVSTTTGYDPSLQLAKFGPNATVKLTVPVGESFQDMKPQLKAEYKCYDSPLYLYPEVPTDVSVQVTNADILSTNLPYSTQTGWTLRANPDGTLEAGEVLADKVEYAYGSEYTVPSTGVVTEKASLEQTLVAYAGKLGLSEKESADYVAFWMAELPDAPYYVVSHFADPASIMNFDIQPKPETFIQAIMYFKPLGEEQVGSYLNLPTPSFETIAERNGFTAVDWSGIIDN